MVVKKSSGWVQEGFPNKAGIDGNVYFHVLNFVNGRLANIKSGRRHFQLLIHINIICTLFYCVINYSEIFLCMMSELHIVSGPVGVSVFYCLSGPGTRNSYALLINTQ